jgi:hypothetical protein
MHFQDGLTIDGWVIVNATESLADFRVAVFGVGHVNIDDSFDQAEGRQGVIAAGVEDQGDAQSCLSGEQKGFEDLRNDVAWADEVDVVCAGVLQSKHERGELWGGDGVAVTEVTDVVVLAIDARKIAVGEEDGSGAAGSDEGRFFAEVQMCTAHHGESSCMTFTFFVGQTVGFAVFGAESAAGETFQSGIHTGLENAVMKGCDIGRPWGDWLIHSMIVGDKRG